MRRAVVFLMVASVANSPLAGAPQDAGSSDAKAKFLANAPAFVEWPAAAFATAAAPLVICVHGDFPFGTALAELTRGESVHGRRVEIKWVRGEQNLAGCQVLFVTRSMARKYAKVLLSVKDTAALTIGEEPEFLKAGGMLNLQSTGKGLAFDVNLEAVLQEHLKISSQFLSLARRVLRGPEMASI